ncbi:MAG TPA: putative Ig domain-containing protein [Solirubrobacteraceae bacterium]|jgi:alpha-tubulin suppressor-like RCC1 family protein|nr:putative Ig domain-containing protein [Solirubrobacteraceae bacterium]
MPFANHRRSRAIGCSLGLAALVAALQLALFSAGAAAASASSAGELFAFGGNGWGQLGSTLDIGQLGGEQLPTPSPTPVALPGAVGAVVQIAAGARFSLALTASGQLYAFGENGYGQLGSTLGNGSEVANPTPALVRLPGATGAVSQIAAGASHSLALTATGQLYAFGANRYGQLGVATNSGSEAANPTPAIVSLPADAGPAVAIAAGAADSLVSTAAGRLYSFGENNYGQLGVAADSGSEAANPAPAQVSLPLAAGRPAAIAAGSQHSLVLGSTGRVYAFGANRYGQLGRLANVESEGANPAPVEVALPAGAGAASEIAAGASHSLVLSAGGSVYAFGENDDGQLGGPANVGSEAANAQPMPVSLPGADGAPIAIGAGESESLAITATGQLFAFGSNLDGQLGSAANSGAGTPNATALAVELPLGTTIDAVAQGPTATHVLALVADLAVLSSSLPPGQIGVGYGATAVASGGEGGYTWSASGLPLGLSIDPASGQIGGTPTAPGTSEVVLHVSDRFGVGASSAAIALTIAGLPSPPRAFVSSTLTEAEIRASLHQQLGIKGSSARIASVRKHRSFTYGFTALTAGLLTIDWYYVPPGAHLARRAAPVLLAAGRLSFATAGTRKITLKLTPAGRKLLRKRKRIALTAKGTFTPLGKRAITASTSFVLKR